MDTQQGQRGEVAGRSVGKKERHPRRFRAQHLEFVAAVIGLVSVIIGTFAGIQIEQRRSDDYIERLEAKIDELTNSRNHWMGEAEDQEQKALELQRQLDEESKTSSSTTTTTTTLRSGDPGGPLGAGESYLIDLETVAGEGSEWNEDGDLKLDSGTYAHGLKSDYLGYCNGVIHEREVQYSLGRDFTNLNSIAGLSEDSPPGLPLKVEFFAITGEAGESPSGAPLGEPLILNVGQPVPVELDVTNVLRLRILATTQFDDPGGCKAVYAALANPILS